LCEHLAFFPAKLGADNQGAGFLIEFYTDDAEIIPAIGVVLRGRTTSPDPLFALLEERFGWILTHS
jgi:hypothetical protein